MRVKLCILATVCFILSSVSPISAQSSDDEFELDLVSEIDTPQTPPQANTQPPATPDNTSAPQSETSPETTVQDPDEKEVFLPPEVAAIPQLQKPVRPKKPQVDLLTKVHSGAKFTIDDVEYWIYNTPDINTCFENGQTMLLYLISRYTNAAAVKLLIDNGADLQTHCTPRFEALFIAAINNPSATIIETLIEGGANIVEQDYEKNTALILAATFNSSPNVIDTLIDYGIKVDTTNQYGYNALILAAYENKNLSVLRALIDNNADVNATDQEGHTALMAAAIRKRDDVMKYLISRGADYKARDKNGISVLDYYNQRVYLNMPDYIKPEEPASPSKHLSEEFKFITQKHQYYNQALFDALKSPTPLEDLDDAFKNLAAADSLNEDGCSLLLAAVQNNNNLEVLKYLINAKTDPNATCYNGRNALMFLASIQTSEADTPEQIKKIEYLLANGLDINATDEYGNTALMYAVGNQADPEVIQTLLKANADVNLENQDKNTALWITLQQQSDPETLKLLLEYGANPNQKDSRGESPIWYQLHNKGESKEAMTIALLRAGADINRPNAAGDFPLWYAFNNNLPTDTLEA
ncbi:MAG: ankyrin repeat domain-containing protein, partial [Alphaproteobacteria bacterium]|nr:ankyrin repeat domain-containing protein [Alphaproteobacteria bacterium]